MSERRFSFTKIKCGFLSNAVIDDRHTCLSVPLTKRRGSAEAGLRRELAEIGEPPVQFKSVAIQLQLLSNSRYYPIPVTIQIPLLSNSSYYPIPVTIQFSYYSIPVTIPFQLLSNSSYFPIPVTTPFQ